MKCYEIAINGEVKYTAGVEAADQFEARVDKLPGEEVFIFSVSASLSSQGGAAVSWGVDEISLGDEINIRLVESNAPDFPRHSGNLLAESEENAQQGDEMSCSFCGKSPEEVSRLIAGPDAYICSDCVGFCADLLKEDPKA